MDDRFEGDGYMGKNPSSEAVVTLWSQTIRVNGDRYGGGEPFINWHERKGMMIVLPNCHYHQHPVSQFSSQENHHIRGIKDDKFQFKYMSLKNKE